LTQTPIEDPSRAIGLVRVAARVGAGVYQQKLGVNGPIRVTNVTIEFVIPELAASLV
jgi:hypothetical protein